VFSPGMRFKVKENKKFLLKIIDFFLVEQISTIWNIFRQNLRMNSVQTIWVLLKQNLWFYMVLSDMANASWFVSNHMPNLNEVQIKRSSDNNKRKKKEFSNL
jgi:hypothetical protein